MLLSERTTRVPSTLPYVVMNIFLCRRLGEEGQCSLLWIVPHHSKETLLFAVAIVVLILCGVALGLEVRRSLAHRRRSYRHRNGPVCHVVRLICAVDAPRHQRTQLGYWFQPPFAMSVRWSVI